MVDLRTQAREAVEGLAAAAHALVAPAEHAVAAAAVLVPHPAAHLARALEYYKQKN